MMDYVQWISEWLQNNDPHLKCATATLEMVSAFPELTRIRGHVWLCGGYERPHWWCIDKNGDVVDPTASQFNGIVMYEPWDESLPEPTGVCANCGGYTYNHATCCSDKCHAEYCAYISKGV
jgi:hypothetical protein